jgi:hypothetical protein
MPTITPKKPSAAKSTKLAVVVAEKPATRKASSVKDPNSRKTTAQSASKKSSNKDGSQSATRLTKSAPRSSAKSSSGVRGKSNGSRGAATV